MPNGPSGQIQINDFQGLNLAQDVRQFTKTAVLRGQNFTINAEGVKADFASELISEYSFGTSGADRSKTFRQNGYIVQMVTGAILRYDTTSQRYYPLFQFTDQGLDWPWTQAFVGGEYYYAKYGVANIIRYTPTTDTWQLVSGFSAPATPYGVAESGGRLVCLADGLIAWSDIDTGWQFTSDSSKGTGVQALSIGGGGTPLGITKTNVGFLVFTTTGTIRGRNTQATSPYSFDQLLVEDVPINPWCIQTITGGKVIFLTKVGFYETQHGFSYSDGDQPKPWEPLMSEYLSQKFFRTVDLTKQTIIRISYSQDNNWVFVSLASNADPTLYLIAYVLYLPTSKWGQFNRPHHALGEFDLAAGPYAGFNFGYICDLGFVHRFTNNPHYESTRQTAYSYWWRPQFDPPAQNALAGATTPVIFGTQFILATEPLGAYISLAAGVYQETVVNVTTDPVVVAPFVETDLGQDTTFDDWLTNPFAEPDEDWLSLVAAAEDWGSGYDSVIFVTGINEQIVVSFYTLQGLVPVYNAIDSQVDLGLFRFSDQQTVDRISIVNALTVGSNTQYLQTLEDYLTTSNPDEDWNLSTAMAEDWGADFPNASNFEATLVGTLDGVNQFEDQSFDLTSVLISNGAVFYKQDCSGVYVYLRLSAQVLNEFFHLKTLEVQGILGGRLF